MTGMVESSTGIPVSATSARAAGLRSYFTGLPCRNGHVAKRSVANHTCRECENERRQAKRLADPAPFRAKDRRQYWKDVQKSRASQSAARLRNLDQRRAYDKARYHGDPARRAWQMKQAGGWWKLNKGKKNFMTARRRAHIRQATPKWLTPAQHAEIRRFYQVAASRPTSHHVDHIVPLRIPRGVLIEALEPTWREAVAQVLRKYHGPVPVQDLYRVLAEHPKARRNRNYRAKIRQTLQRGAGKRVAHDRWVAA